MTAAATASLPPCRACGASRAGAYCQDCGQAGPEVPRAFGEVLSGQTGRLLHTLRLLFLEPGELAREIIEGRDRRSMRPLTLLLNLIPLFFLIGGGAHGYSAHAFVASDPSGRAAHVITSRSERLGVPRAVMEEHVEQRFRSIYSLLVVVQALAYGLAIGVVERRKRLPWLVHLSAGIHYLCVSFVVATLAFGGGRVVGIDMVHTPLAGVAMYAVLIVYMTLMLARAYVDPLPVAFGKALAVLLFGYLVALVLSVTAVLAALLTA